MAIKRIPEIEEFLEYAREHDLPSLALNTLGDFADIAFDQEAEDPKQAEFWAAFGGKLQDMEIELREFLDSMEEEQD